MPQEIIEFQSKCEGVKNAIEQFFKEIDKESYILFQKLRLLLKF